MPSDEPRGTIGASGGEDRDKAEPEGEGEGPIVSSGRHAARRRTLFQRLHMPVGKAVALAAMPSAVLLGTGFTSPLAKADQQPENPFTGDSCVEMPDVPPEDLEEPAGRQEQQRPQQQQQQTQEQDADRRGDATAQPDREPATERPEDPTAGATDQAEPGAEAEHTEDTEGSAEGSEDAATGDSGTAEGSDSSGDGLLGGLGQGLQDVGDGLADLLTPGEDQGEASEEPEPEPTQSAEGEDTAESGETAQASPDPGPSETEAQPDPEPTPEPTPEPEPTSEPEPEPEPSAEPNPSAQQSPAQGEGGQPFPCPEEKLVPGVDEETALTLPNDPWFLECSSLTLYGLDYHGVVNVTTADGTTKQVLKFTAEKVDIVDLHQIVDAPDGVVRQHVATEPGSTSTFRNGTVTMYTERLSGNLFGLIPITFDPEHQPPLDLPIANFTDVFAIQAGQFGGELSLTGMNSYFTHDGPTPTD